MLGQCHSVCRASPQVSTLPWQPPKDEEQLSSLPELRHVAPRLPHEPHRGALRLCDNSIISAAIGLHRKSQLGAAALKMRAAQAPTHNRLHRASRVQVLQALPRRLQTLAAVPVLTLAARHTQEQGVCLADHRPGCCPLLPAGHTTREGPSAAAVDQLLSLHGCCQLGALEPAATWGGVPDAAEGACKSTAAGVLLRGLLVPTVYSEWCRECAVLNSLAPAKGIKEGTHSMLIASRERNLSRLQSARHYFASTCA